MLDHYVNCVGDKSTCVRRVLSHLSDRAPPLVWKDGQIEIWQKRFNAATKEVINETFRHTTQAYKSVQVEQRTRPRHFFKKKYPAFAFNRLREWVYSDTVFLDHNKKHPYQFFYASKSKVTYMVKLNGNMKAKTTCDALLSFFQDVGMPYGVATDGAKNEVLSKVWKKFLKDYPCETHSSEPNCQYQNRCERSWQTIQSQATYALHRTSVALHARLLDDCYLHAVDLWNHMSNKGLEWHTPHEVLYGVTPDISMFRFCLGQPI